MPKRKAPVELDEIVAADSPASKRPRASDEEDQSDNTSPNGHLSNTPDILGADIAKHEELVETGAVDGLEEDYNLGNDHHDGDEDASEDEYGGYTPASLGLGRKAPPEGYQDLYLETINRKALDFDFEKLCSVTLSNINVYACLICGKYFQGRGPTSQAYFHALEERHHVYINLESKRIYILPDGYETLSKSLDDIKFVLDPQFTKEQVLALDRPLSRGQSIETLDLEGKGYVPGFIGINNIKANDYFNVIVQLLSHVSPLRNYFLMESLGKRSQLVQRFGTLIRKIWNPRAFKAHVSPHELLQEIALRSSKRFNLTEQADPVEFAHWFLNALHSGLGGSKTKSSIVSSVFRGTVRTESQEITAYAAGDRLRFDDNVKKQITSPFLILALDLPPTPLFQDGTAKNIIPQVALTTLLAKYNGITTSEAANHRKRYRLQHPLPPYLLFHVKRFTSNKFLSSERNPTIVTFASTSAAISTSPFIDMSPYVAPSAEFPSSEPIIYDLIANITHEAVKVREDSVEGEAEKREWRVQLLDRRSGSGAGKGGPRWWELQDLWVRSRELEDSGQLFARESYAMVWERRRVKKGSGSITKSMGKKRADN